MDDLISRQALLKQIDIDSDDEPGYYGDTWKFIDTIKSMPSAELGTNLAEVGTDCISRQAAIRWIKTECNPYGKPTLDYETSCRIMEHLDRMPSAQPTLYGYNIEHLKLIATVLQKENLPPERVVEALTDIGRIVAIVRDEFEETLRKAVEQCMT